jgi:hypothetical protein
MGSPRCCGGSGPRPQLPPDPAAQCTAHTAALRPHTARHRCGDRHPGHDRAAGFGLLAWLTTTAIASVIPEIGVTAALSAGTVAAAVLLGAAAAAPLFTLRRLRRTDIPATLRVME